MPSGAAVSAWTLSVSLGTVVSFRVGELVSMVASVRDGERLPSLVRIQPDVKTARPVRHAITSRRAEHRTVVRGWLIRSGSSDMIVVVNDRSHRV